MEGLIGIGVVGGRRWAVGRIDCRGGVAVLILLS